jgi:hypothetical protein
MDIIPPEDFKTVLKQYRKGVPSVGTVSSTVVDEFLAAGRTCRGWTDLNGRKQYFHIIKSPGRYPEKSVFYADSETELLQMTIHLGLQHEIHLEDLFQE